MEDGSFNHYRKFDEGTVHYVGTALLLSLLSSHFYLLNRHSIKNFFNQISLTYINQLSLKEQCYQVPFD